MPGITGPIPSATLDKVCFNYTLTGLKVNIDKKRVIKKFCINNKIAGTRVIRKAQENKKIARTRVIIKTQGNKKIARTKVIIKTQD